MIRFQIGEVEAQVEVVAGGASVNGEKIAIEIQEVGSGSYLARRGAESEIFHCVALGENVYLAWRGRSYRLARLGEGRRRAQRHAAGGLEAPMPGRIAAVKVQPGQSVRKGEELLVVEAMKMENAVRAPRDGKVLRVLAQVGEMVAPGRVLVEIES